MSRSMLSLCRSHIRRVVILSRVSVTDCQLPVQLVEQRRRRHKYASPWKPELIIFDQYGTLINIHSVWQPWVERISKRLECATGLDLQQKIYRTLDICRFTKRIRLGTLGEGTTAEIKRSLGLMLLGEGLSWLEAEKMVTDSWEDCRPAGSRDHIRETKKIFSELKSAGTRIAVCSSDVRSRTMENLRLSGLTGLIDHVTCGDDVDDARGVAEICASVDADVERTVVIGDAVADMMMGRQAGVALTVGVLSGAGTRLDLAGVADVVTDDIGDAVDYLKTLTATKLGELARGRDVIRPDKGRASVVIFDKDGTLLCFHSLWTPWVEQMIAKLEAVSGLQLSDKIFEGLGYCRTAKRWRPALFAEGTNRQCMEKIADILTNEGIKRSEAMEMIRSVWPAGDHSRKNRALKLLDNPASVFRTLQMLGIKVAVCTADSRQGTEQFLAENGAISYVDMIVCGDDRDSLPKPDARNALWICEALGADPDTAVVVGDTPADMGMGRAAKLGATVAVLTGVGDVTHLAPHADYVVPSISHVFDVVTSASDRQYAIDLYKSQLRER